MRRSFLVFILVFISFINGYSQPGLLDVGFGNGGKVITNIAQSNTYGLQANEVVRQPDGKLVVVAGSYYDLNVDDSTAFFVVRYNIDGSMDTTFGTGGVVNLVINNNIDLAVTLALQADGKIIAAGSTKFNRYYSDWLLVRLQTNGAVDSTFGVNGIVTTSRGPYNEKITALIIKPNGKILAAGNTSPLVFTEVLQFLPNGKIDSLFGTNGVARHTTGISITGMVLQTDGKIVVAGDRTTDTLGLTRFTATGQVDSSFGINGYAFLKYGYVQTHSLTIQPDGKLIVTGGMVDSFGSGRHIGMARFQSNGTADSSFGKYGKVFYPQKGVDDGYKVFVRPDGKLLLIGSVNKGFSYIPRYNGNFAIVKFNSNGSPDSTFGRRGIVLTDFAGKDDEAFSGLIQPDGKIVVVGSSVSPITNKNVVALARYESNVLTNYNTVIATVFMDNNLNGTKDSTEVYFSEGEIVTMKPGVDTLRIASNGKYSIEVDTGTYITRAIPYYPYYTALPANFTTSHADYFNHDTVAFGVQPIPGKRDLSIQIIALGAARPGFPLQYKILYRNNGTDTIANDTIQLIKSSRVQFNSAFPAADFILADTLKWNLVNFKPFDSASILVNCTVKAPPATQNGDSIRASVSIKSFINDLTPADNRAFVLQIARGSYDPNDKAENHGGSISLAAVTTGEYLVYTIRFQNTGTDTAFNVFVRDTLSTLLNWSSFRMLTASHPFQLTTSEGNKCLWNFPNINLPDSNINTVGSHGYLVFMIKPASTVAIGDVIANRAFIYFDYNLPVQTNEEQTTVVVAILPLHLLSFTAKKNDKVNLLQWTTANEVNVDKYEVERSGNGREYVKIQQVKGKLQNENNYAFTDIAPLPAYNYYRLRMVDKDGKYAYSPVRVIHNSNDYVLKVYPNPVKDRLQVWVTPTATDGSRKTILNIDVVSHDGNVIFSKKWTVGEGPQMNTINTSTLPGGHYVIRVTTANNEQWVVGFEKE